MPKRRNRGYRRVILSRAEGVYQRVIEEPVGPAARRASCRYQQAVEVRFGFCVDGIVIVYRRDATVRGWHNSDYAARRKGTRHAPMATLAEIFHFPAPLKCMQH